MKHGDKIGVGALAIHLLGALLLCAMWIWVDSPIRHLEMFAFCLLWGGFLISFYAAIRGSRWWLLLPYPWFVSGCGLPQVNMLDKVEALYKSKDSN
jgi:hypothetical protein